MKKRIVFSVFIFSMMSLLAFADGRYIAAEAIPAGAKTFLNKYFANVAVVYPEQEYNEFEVHLENGVEIEFTGNGDWKSVDAKWQPIPTTIVPPSVLAAVKAMYPKAAIVKIEKDWNGFDIELDNRMELKVADNGKVYEVEFND